MSRIFFFIIKLLIPVVFSHSHITSLSVSIKWIPRILMEISLIPISQFRNNCHLDNIESAIL